MLKDMGISRGEMQHCRAGLTRVPRLTAAMATTEA